MKYEPIDGGFKKLKEDLSKLTFKEKLNHLWTYYKGSLVILAIIIALCSIITSSCRARNTETILAGISINVMLSDEGQSYVKDEYYELSKTEGLQQVIYTETHQDDFSTTTALEDNYTALMSLLALCTAEELDYLFLNDVSVKNLLVHGVYMDLRNFFTEDELEALGDNVVWMASGPEDEAVYMTVAVKVEHIPFIAEHATNISDTYFSVVTNTPRLEEVRNFWEYINAWTPAN